MTRGEAQHAKFVKCFWKNNGINGKDTKTDDGCDENDNEDDDVDDAVKFGEDASSIHSSLTPIGQLNDQSWQRHPYGDIDQSRSDAPSRTPSNPRSNELVVNQLLNQRSIESRSSNSNMSSYTTAFNDNVSSRADEDPTKRSIQTQCDIIAEDVDGDRDNRLSSKCRASSQRSIMSDSGGGGSICSSKSKRSVLI